MDDPDNLGDDNRRAWHTDDAWAQLRRRMDAADHAQERRRQRIRIGLTTAAAGAALAAGTVFFLTHPHAATRSAPAVTHVVATAPGEHKTVQLSDGSAITLAPATTVRWTESRERRDVELDGLADFRVVHDSARPFTVRAGQARVTDIGTEFVVRAYAGDAATRVTVLSGIVNLARLQQSPTEASVTLRMGDVGMVGPSIATRLTRAVAGDSAWLHGALRFDNVPLSAVAAELERWFGTTIAIDDAALAHKRVTAIYTQPDLEPVIEAIAATTGSTVVRDGKSFHLRIRGR